jgi:CHAT domain-containing protein
VLRDWKLDAELVTVSACDSGRAKYEFGEGFVGFGQAVVLAGSRGVCLSLWKVDDAAKDAPPYAHPYHWAAFVLLGDPG